MTLIIRQATPGDLPGVHQMMKLLAHHHGDVTCITPERLREHLFDTPIGHLVVAGEEEGLVGYGLLLPRSHVVTGGTGQDIQHLFVVEWRRKAGVGRALIAALRQGSRAVSDNLDAEIAYCRTGLAERSSPGAHFRVELA